MDMRQAFITALKSLLARRVRSLLTMLGVIIGVAAVVVIVTVGRGNMAKVEAEFDDMGANMISVNIYGRSSARWISVEDTYRFVSDNPELLRDLSPSVSVGGGIKYDNRSYLRTAISGVSEDYPKTQLLELAEGNFLQYMDVERRARVCVAGGYVADEIMGGAALGKTLKIRGQNYRVIGVLVKEDPLADRLSGEGGADDVVYIPYTNVLKLGEVPYVSSYTLNSADRDCSEAAVALLEEFLLSRYTSDDFRIVSQKARMEMMLAMQNGMLAVLWAIAGIALLVGGVGVMNITSISVSERTKEIGVRKSFGARRRDIRLQFIVEAVCTSMTGGLLGAVAGVAASAVACGVMELNFQLAGDAMLLSFGTSVGLGVVFGLLPAERAAKMEPIDALRHE